MKENEHVAETRDWTWDIQILSLTLSQLTELFRLICG